MKFTLTIDCGQFRMTPDEQRKFAIREMHRELAEQSFHTGRAPMRRQTIDPPGAMIEWTEEPSHAA